MAIREGSHENVERKTVIAAIKRPQYAAHVPGKRCRGRHAHLAIRSRGTPLKARNLQVTLDGTARVTRRLISGR